MATSLETDRIITQMVGGSLNQFLSAHWRQRILVVRNCLPALRSFYSVNQFIDDYVHTDFHEATLVIDIVKGRRRFTIPANLSVVSQGLRRGSSIALQVLKLPIDLPDMPGKWRWMIDLHSGLRDYFLSGFPTEQFPGAPISAIDVFCTTSPSTTGGHHDTGDVFFLALEGEKEWTVEYEPDLHTVHQLQKAQVMSRLDLQPVNESTTVVLAPGDCLYVPPYTYHRVRSSGSSLGVSMGLPAFNVIHLLAHKLSSLTGEAKFARPLPSLPRSEEGGHLAAKAEQHRQVRELLEALAQMNA